MSQVPAKQRGFTLVELLVVVGLIAVLIAATLTIVPKVTRAVYGARTQAQMAAIASAIQMYYNDFHSYPGPLANNQLYTAADSTPSANEPAIPGLGYLQGKSDWNSTNDPSGVTKPFLDATTLDPTRITSSQNLMLGLNGGLRINISTNPATFEYHPGDLISAQNVNNQPSLSPGAHGPANLDPNNPRKQQAYLSNMDRHSISYPNNTMNNGAFTDSASRAANDAMIPVFVDQYSEQLPILYFRTNVGGTAIAGLRDKGTFGAFDDDSGQLKDSNGNFITPQFDLTQNLAYTTSKIGTIGNNTNSLHGLIGLGNSNLSDPIDTNIGGTYTPANSGKNGLAYFKDPTLNVPGTSTNTYQGVARQKNGFLLISAGPDRQYGTHDDLVYPGPLVP